MEDEIDASPTSQKKRKRLSKCHSSQKMSKTDEANIQNTNVITMDLKSDQHISPVGPTIEVSECLTRRDILQYAVLLERADKTRFSSETSRNNNRNAVRMSGRSGFINMTQHCASQSTTASNINEVKESQWVTESQFRNIDDAVKEYQDSEIKGQKTGTSDSIEVKDERMDESIDFAQPVAKTVVVDDCNNEDWTENTNVGQNPLKRHSSVLESIYSDWPTSPLKKNKTQSEVMQLSPKFIFYRRSTRRTYFRKQDSGATNNMLPQVKKSSPTTASRRRVNSDGEVENDNQEVYVPSDSMNVNIQSLTIFYSQSELTLIENDVNETFKTIMDSKSVGLSKTSASLYDEADFLGFDVDALNTESNTVPVESITLPDRFYEFDSHSENMNSSSTTNATALDHDLLMGDEDIFANFQTQQFGQYVSNNEARCSQRPVAASSSSPVGAAFKDDVLNKNWSKESNRNCIDAKDAGATNTLNKAVNLFEDIEREFAITLGRPDGCVEVIDQSINFFAGQNRDSESLLPRTTAHLNPNPSFTGFTTAGGKPIPVSSALVSKKTNIFLNDNVSEDELKKMGNWIGDTNPNGEPNENGSPGMRQRNVDLHPQPTFVGFSTARGNHIPVATELISKKTNIFHNVNVSAAELKTMNNWIDDHARNDPNIDAVINQSCLDLIPKTAFTGFTTAGGKEIPVSSALVSKKTNIFLNDNVTDNELKKMDNWIGDTNPNGEPNVNDSLGIQRCNVELNPNAAFAGFTTARGNHIPVATEKTNIFQNENFSSDELQEMNIWIDDIEQNGSSYSERSTDVVRRNPIASSLFSTPVNSADDEKKKQSNPADFFREVTNLNQRDTDTASKKWPVDTFVRPSPMRKMSMMNSLRKLETLKENVDVKLNSVIDGNASVNSTSVTSPINATTSMMHTPTSSKAYIYVTPTNNPKTYTQEGRESAAAINLDDEMYLANQSIQSKEQTPTYVTGFMAELTVSSTPIQKVDNYRNRPTQRRLVETFDDIAGEDYFEASVSSQTVKVKVPADIISLRKIALKEQHRRITKKLNVKPVPSSLFVKKLTSTKVNWKEFVEHSRPVNKPVTDTKVTDSVLNVTSENAAKFKFNAWDYYPEEFCRENINGIYLQDDIVVMMDGNCQIGLEQISTAFLSCPSVDPKLIHHKWIENNMKWIVTKLAAMERSFPHRFAGQALTLENFMLQMKYRYEREIDRAERSAIRKICETDDVSAKRMILFVAKISKNSFSCEIELSDGWYSLSSTLDYEMTKLVNSGQIKVGTKLVIQGAITLDLDNACHPLDVSSNVKLRICANSTRRARWDSKLGYCNNPEPFTISLRSVLANGGNITKLRICVLRVYPVVYINTKKLTDVHSEKVERRRSVKDERDKLSIVEKIYNQVSEDFEEEEKAARCENRPMMKTVKLADVSKITDPAYLCDLIDEDNDPGRIESEMTNTQKTMVLNYKEKLNCLRSDAIRTRVNEKFASLNKDALKFVCLLKFKITDQMSFDKTAVVSVWKPTEEVHSMIKEGTFYELTGSSTRGKSFNELQIYAGQEAVFKQLNVNNQVPTSLCRHHTSISEILSIDQLPLNELDTTGFVVHVGDCSQKYQPVYIADSNVNIVCIYFLESLARFAYDDIVQPKRCLAIKNLQWRTTSNSKPIPCTYATEYSTFTENPQSSELSSAITCLRTELANVELDAFIESCMEKIRSHNSSYLSTTSSLQQSSASSLPITPNDISLRSSRSSLGNQSRIERLSKYIDAKSPVQCQLFKSTF